jgi:beta-fructofuranosidase
MEVTVWGEYDGFTIKLAANEEHETCLIYDKKQGILTLDRNKSGMEKDGIKERRMYVSCMKTKENLDAGEEVLQLRLIMDKYSVEIFANEGRAVMTALMYTPEEATGITFGVEGKATFSVEKYHINLP